MEQETERKKQLKKKNRNIVLKNLLILLIKMLLIIGIGFVFLKFVFGFTVARDISMAPSITEGELLLFYRLEKNYNTDDVVVIKKDNKEYILRIVAKPGEKVSITDKGAVLVNDVTESHVVFYKTKTNDKVKYPYTVKDDEYFVMGDYRIEDNDSRIFGSIKTSEIKGIVIGKLKIRDI